MKKKYLLFILILLFLELIGCSDTVKYDKIEIWKTDAKDFQNGWVMKTDFPDNKFGTYLGNGYFGMRLFSKGLCYDNNPSECYMAGVYINENLITVPNIADIRFYEVNNSHVTEFIPTDKNFSQCLDMKTATLSTERVYQAGNKKIKTKIESKVLRLNDKSSRVMIKINILPQYNGEFFVVAPVDYSKENFKFSNNSYKILGNSKTDTLYVKQNFIINGADKNDKYHSLKTICMGDYNQAEQALFSVKKNSEINITYCSEISKDPIISLLDENECKKYENEHLKNWAELWKSDIEIEGDNEAQQIVRSNLFYLLCSASEDYSIAPMGLSHNSFSGHIFWDAEMWMFPALIWQYPQFAKGMLKYRINTLEGAMQNAENHSMKGAEYAWESGESGIETSPDPSTIYERHINGDIAFAIWEYYLFTEDKEFLKEAYPVLKNTADYWISKTEKGKKGLYEIKHICAPDENANIVDNSVYTNAITQINLWIATEAGLILGEPVNPEYMNIANNIYIGVDKTNNRFIIYDNYSGNKIKQADPELLIYPLQYNKFIKKLNNTYNFSDEILKNTFDFYKNNVVSNGPAMTSSVHSVISARNKSEVAYEDFKNSYSPYMRGYFNYFNEKGSSTYENWCFLTGSASSFASILWGFCGLNVDLYENYTKNTFMFSNNLPKEWKSINIKGIKFKGKTYNIQFKDNTAVIL